MWKLLRYVWKHPLNVNGRFAALLRVLRWQLATRLIDAPIAIPFVEETSLLAKRGMAGATGNWYCGLHEENEMAFVLHVLRPTDHVVDVGANIGSYTVLAAGAAQALVKAVEPIPSTFSLLRRNVLVNNLQARVSCHQIGLSDAAGALRFSTDLDTVNHVLAPGENLRGEVVPVMRLDDLVGNEIPTLIKIDVEGHELAVLRGGLATLNDARLLAVILETNGSGERYGVSDDAVFALMKAHGFLPHRYDPFARQLFEGSDANGNTIFVRCVDVVVARCQNARRFQLVNGVI